MILQGSFSGRRYRVEGKFPPNPAQHWGRSLTRHTFVPIDPASDKTRVIGWVNPRRILEESIYWDQLIFGPHLVIGLRVDTRKVPRQMLRARLDQAIVTRLREQPGTRVGREERTRIAKAIETEMLAQTPPATAVQELWWNTANGTAWFSSSSVKSNEEVTEQFEKTFDLRLVPLLPFTLAERHTEEAGKGGGALERAVVTDFRPR